MKKVFLIFITLLLLACRNNEDSLIRNYKMDIACYRLKSNTIDHNSKFNFNIRVKSIHGDTIKFLYYNEGLTDYIDTLIIYSPDSLVLRNQLKLISEKMINLNGKRISARKYRSCTESLGPYGNVYINNSMGILATRFLSHPYGEKVIFYNPDQFSDLHKEIINDTIFFEGNWLD